MSKNKKGPYIEIPHTQSRIGLNAEYDGTLHFETSLGVLGKFKGEIIGGELLVIHPNAVVEGSVNVDYLLVIGTIHGKINARKGVFFFENSVIRGNVKAAVIRMQSGVDFEGEFNLNIDDEIDIFKLSREVFYTTMFDRLIHELDSIPVGNSKSENSRTKH